jgi:hypothetical protein
MYGMTPVIDLEGMPVSTGDSDARSLEEILQ